MKFEKKIKNYVRSAMSTLRLRNLAMLSIEQELTDEVAFDDVSEEFANKKIKKNCIVVVLYFFE